jgi:hypothetical protein
MPDSPRGWVHHATSTEIQLDPHARWPARVICSCGEWASDPFSSAGPGGWEAMRAAEKAGNAHAEAAARAQSAAYDQGIRVGLDLLRAMVGEDEEP